jgi:hypothetical protein
MPQYSEYSVLGSTHLGVCYTINYKNTIELSGEFLVVAQSIQNRYRIGARQILALVVPSWLAIRPLDALAQIPIIDNYAIE